MSAKKRLPGAADYLDELEDEQEKASPAPKGRTKASAPEADELMAFRVPGKFAREIRGAAKALDFPQAAIVRGAIERELERLRHKYNQDRPFPDARTRRSGKSKVP